MFYMLVFTLVLIILFAAGWLFFHKPSFGKLPGGGEAAIIRQSPHFREGKFQNLQDTPDLAEGVNYSTILLDFIFRKDKNVKPAKPIPAVKTDLMQLPTAQDWVVWFGHSSYFLYLEGKTILADPVFSGHASPVKFTTRAFPGTDAYTAADIPVIDFLFLTHDHWDHLDYSTLQSLQPKIRHIVTSLGVKTHLLHWGFDASIITCLDWDESISMTNGFRVTAITARHFSGRTFKRNQSLWSAFVLQTQSRKIFIGGDSGYGDHFKTTGDRHGPFDLALLECGQYNAYWKYIHMMPEETARAATDLQARQLLPVHWGKFSLAMHAWDEPIERLSAACKSKNISLLHPKIGEAVNLDAPPLFTAWWQDIQD